MSDCPEKSAANGGGAGAGSATGAAAAGQAVFTGTWVQVKARRVGHGPILRPEMLPGDDGANINGPCLLRVPEWVASPLARYYLYFAHHGGKYIRLALADRLEGPWRIHPGGVLDLGDLPFGAGHVASPELFVDQAARQIRLYFHVAKQEGRPVYSGPYAETQWANQLSHVALSADGLRFAARPDVLAAFYLRVFRHEGQFYGLAKEGAAAVLVRSVDGLTTFARGPQVLPRCRHCGILRRGRCLWVFFSCIGDAPEQIGVTRLDLGLDWQQWGPTSPPAAPVLRPELEWEGAGYPVAPSKPSAGSGVNQVRDPYVYLERGRVYLFYSVAGESGIGLAELTFRPPSQGPLAR